MQTRSKAYRCLPRLHLPISISITILLLHTCLLGQRCVQATPEALHSKALYSPLLNERNNAPASAMAAHLPSRFTNRGDSGISGGVRQKLQSAEGGISLHSPRRELGDNVAYYSLGASLSFNSGPGLADVNSTLFRYASVTPLAYVDWRSSTYMTPVQRQFSCQSCWAMAAVDSVAIMTAIANNASAVPLSTQQVCDCGSSKSCCDGGWPEDAYAYIFANGNVTSDDEYPYEAANRNTCGVGAQQSNSSFLPAAAKISGWEQVPAYDQTALMKAVTVQPVLVLISASAMDFQRYSSFGRVNVYNGNCSTEINHAVLVVGYNLTGQYWIIKNTWPRTWGDGGYMYIAMQPGAGKCGMLTNAPMYPVYFPNAPQQVRLNLGSKFPEPADATGGRWWTTWPLLSSTTGAPRNACAAAIHPCGAGQCYSENGFARCNCSAAAGFVEVVGVPTSKCVPARPCGLLVNPCGAGTCNDSSADGSYACQCAPGFIIGARSDGSPTCVSASSSAASTYVTQYGDTCTKIQTGYGITASSFSTLNPFLSCAGPLVPGLVVAINSFTVAGCTRTYITRPSDTCASISQLLTSMPSSIASATTSLLYGTSTSLTSTSSSLIQTVATATTSTATNLLSLLQTLNPLLNCSSLYASQTVCINATRNATADVLAQPPAAVATAAAPVCGQSYVTKFGDTCNSVAALYGLNSTRFASLNVALNCNSAGGSLPVGIGVCVADGPNMTDTACTRFTRVQQGGSCPTLWNAYNLTQSVFLALNPGIRCQAPHLQVGQQVCVNSSRPRSLPDTTVQDISYTVQPNDTLSYIASFFIYRCTRASLAPANIAARNFLPSIDTRLPVNSTLLIPCVPRVGASCGCTSSIPVCGADYVTYQSYCDAQCNYALPVRNSNKACDSCQAACVGRAGYPPNPTSACSENTVCGYPSWQPPSADCTQIVGSGGAPSCRFANTSCENVCTSVANTLGGTSSTRAANYNACYSQCFCCARIPCAGPSCQLPQLASKGNCTTTPECSYGDGVCSAFAGSTVPCQTCSTAKTGALSCRSFCPAFPTTPQA